MQHCSLSVLFVNGIYNETCGFCLVQFIEGGLEKSEDSDEDEESDDEEQTAESNEEENLNEMKSLQLQEEV